MGLKYLYVPSGVKAGTAYGVMPNSADADFDDFTRGSAGSRIDKNGFIESVGSNVPRLDYSDGGCPSLLLEPSRTNYITQSNDFSGWNSGNLYVTSNYAISPDGTQNASRLLFTSFSQNIYTNTTSTGDIVGSLYVKGVSGETIQLFVGGGETLFTLNGSWQRIVVEKTSSTNGFFNINTNGGATARDLLIYGSQLEQGSYPTSYIPTSGSTVTRAAETANGSGNSEVFNDSEGVLMVETSNLISGGSTRVISLSSGSQSVNNIYFNFNASGTLSCQVLTSGGSNSLSTSSISQENNNKILLKYKANDFALWVNGFKSDIDTSLSSTPIGLDRLNFDFGSGSLDFYGKTKEIGYYDTALTDEELEYMTSYRSLSKLVTELNLNTL